MGRMPADPQGAAETGPGPVAGPASAANGWFGRNGARCAPDRDRPDAGTAAAVGDAEGLVEVEVRHVGPEVARTCQPDHGVEVGAVEVHLPAGVVDRTADLADGLLEHAVRRGVGDHQRGEVVGVLGDLGAQVGQVDVARLVARHDHHAHAGHHRAGGVGAVRRRRDQAHVAGALAVGEVVAADGQQAGELALRAGVGLQRHGVVAGDLGERVLELGHELPVAGRLLGRDEGVDRRELGPADGLHLGRGVQLHGARAERDHGPVERQVAVGEPAEVAQQRGLGAVLVEDRVGEERRGAPPLGSQAVGRGDGGVEGRHVDVVDAQGRAHRHDVVAGGGLVARDPHGVGIDATEVHPTGHGGGEDGIGPSRHPHGHRVEERPVHHLEARATGGRGHDAGEAVGALGDGREAVGAVVHRVHAGDDGEQHLGGADVRRGLLAADVLLTGLQRQPVRDGPVGVAARRRRADRGVSARARRARP